MEYKYIGEINDFSFIKMVDIVGYNDLPAQCDYFITFAWSSSFIYNTVTDEFVKLPFSRYNSYCFDLNTLSLYLFKRSVKTKHEEFTLFEYDISNGKLKNKYPLPKAIWYGKYTITIDGIALLTNGTFLISYYLCERKRIIPYLLIYNKETQEYKEIDIPNKYNSLSGRQSQFVIGNDIYILSITDTENDAQAINTILYRYRDGEIELIKHFDSSYEYKIFTDFEQKHLAFIKDKDAKYDVLVISLNNNEHVFEYTFDARAGEGITSGFIPYFEFFFSKDNKNNVLFTRTCNDKVDIYNLVDKTNYQIEYVYNGERIGVQLLANNKVIYDSPEISEQIKDGGRKIMRTVCSFKGL